MSIDENEVITARGRELFGMSFQTDRDIWAAEEAANRAAAPNEDPIPLLERAIDGTLDAGERTALTVRLAQMRAVRDLRRYYENEVRGYLGLAVLPPLRAAVFGAMAPLGSWSGADAAAWRFRRWALRDDYLHRSPPAASFVDGTVRPLGICDGCYREGLPVRARRRATGQLAWLCLDEFTCSITTGGVV